MHPIKTSFTTAILFCVSIPLYAQPADGFFSDTTTSVIIPAMVMLLVCMAGFIAFMVRRCWKNTTSLRRSSEQLERLDSRSQTIIESLPVGVEIYSNEGTLVSLNARDCEIFGLISKEELTGSLSIQNNPNMPEQIKQAFLRKEKIQLELPYDFAKIKQTGFYNTIYKSGVKYITCKGTPVFDRNGEMINYVFIIDDITEKHRQAAQMNRNMCLTSFALRSSDLLLWVYNNQTRLFTSYNDPANDYDETIQISVEDYISAVHPDDMDVAREKIRFMDEGPDEGFSFDVRFKDPGDTDWRHSTVSSIPFSKDESGKVIEYTGFVRDNTQWKNLNDHLRQINAQNELILNNTNSGLAFITTDYMVQWENVSVCSTSITIEAYKKGELCYKSAYGRTSPCENCVMQQAMQSGQVAQKTFRLDGRTVEVFATPVADENGKTEGVVIRLDDITERERMIAELHAAKKSAEQSDKLKSSFLANMSHEIRTPLNAIVGFADLLMATNNPAEKEEYGKIITTNNEILLRLINDILNLSKIEAGYTDRKPEQFDMAPYFNELSVSLRQRVASSKIEFISEEPYKACVVTLDKSRVAQVMMNFVTNSIKYTPQGFIKMGYEYRDGGIWLYVSDSGIGIADDKKHLVFQRFEKLDEFAQGTGLGLSICKAFVDAIRGRIGFESEQGKGSTFWAWLPCDAIVTKIGEDYKPISGTVPVVENRPEQTNKIPSGNSRKRILVVEDIDSNFRLVHAILNKMYDLTWARNGVEAVEKAREEQFDIILMDMKMPVMNGLEATAKIREFDRMTPIVALTAHAFDADREAAMAVGCTDYIVKPINRELLFGVLDKLK